MTSSTPAPPFGAVMAVHVVFAGADGDVASCASAVSAAMTKLML